MGSLTAPLLPHVVFIIRCLYGQTTLFDRYFFVVIMWGICVINHGASTSPRARHKAGMPRRRRHLRHAPPRRPRRRHDAQTSRKVAENWQPLASKPKSGRPRRHASSIGGVWPLVNTQFCPNSEKLPHLLNILTQFAPILKIAQNRKIVCKNRMVFCLQVAKLRRQRKQIIKDFQQ